nr:MAG TPA: hypothetical protein [Caudoviricetes sp.]
MRSFLIVHSSPQLSIFRPIKELKTCYPCQKTPPTKLFVYLNQLILLT